MRPALAWREGDPQTDTLIEIFGTVLLILIVTYAILVLLTIPVTILSRGRVRNILLGYSAVGPPLILTLTLTFTLFLAQYSLINRPFQEMVNPGKIFQEATQEQLESRGPEIRDRLSTRFAGSPEIAVRRAMGNYRILRSSEYYLFLEGFYSSLFHLYRIMDSVLLVGLILIMFLHLHSTSGALLAFPFSSEGPSFWALAREAFFRLIGILFFTLLVGFAVFLPATLVTLGLTTVTLQAGADLFVSYNLEFIVGSVEAPVAPGVVFSILFTFTLMLMEVSLILVATTTLFFMGSLRALRSRGERWTSRLMKREVVDPASRPRLRRSLKLGVLLLLKLAVVMGATWLLLRFVVVRGLGLTASAWICSIVHVGLMNLALWGWKAHRTLQELFGEAIRGLRPSPSRPDDGAPVPSGPTPHTGPATEDAESGYSIPDEEPPPAP